MLARPVRASRRRAGEKRIRQGATNCMSGVKKFDIISLQLKITAYNKCNYTYGLLVSLNTKIMADVKELRVE